MRRQAGNGVGDALDVGLDLRVVAQQRFGAAGVGHAASQFANAFATGGNGGQDRDTQFFGECGNVDHDAAGRCFVMHVERQHHGHAEFSQQRRQRQGAAQILGVADLHKAARRLVEQGLHGRPFVVAARRQGEHAGCVEQHRLSVETGAGPGYFDSGPGVIRNINVGAGQAMKED